MGMVLGSERKEDSRIKCSVEVQWLRVCEAGTSTCLAPVLLFMMISVL